MKKRLIEYILKSTWNKNFLNLFQIIFRTDKRKDNKYDWPTIIKKYHSSFEIFLEVFR
jgi:hypothetical protein